MNAPTTGWLRLEMPPRSRARAAMLAALLLVAVAAHQASAIVVPVPNSSFESPNGGVGNPNGGAATGWTANGGAPSGGVSYFSFGFPAASQGTQYHWLNLPGFAGPHPSVTRSDVGLIGAAQAGSYTLTVAGGRAAGAFAGARRTRARGVQPDVGSRGRERHAGLTGHVLRATHDVAGHVPPLDRGARLNSVHVLPDPPAS